MAKPHDLGGLPAGPIDTTEQEQTLFDKRVDALYALLTHPQRQVVTMDEVRRRTEDLGEARYLQMSYYERWLASLAALLLEKGLAEPGDLPSAAQVLGK
ncbi:SH3-like domain-containing protein [Poseidonocella sp. HB161398]|uniref:SH3-like domain-containing protein n=1 Tax=Poseidonocella sp. HB161398 TaxID=2320855 RepID=UPI00148726C2